MSEKEFKFINESAKRDFLNLPKKIQHQFGVDLNAVQHGKEPFSNFKHLSDSVGPGAIELIENSDVAYRTVYCAKYLNTIYILHTFQKQTNGVDRANMKTAQQRYKLMMQEVKMQRRS